jgi:hypothetical protein
MVVKKGGILPLLATHETNAMESDAGSSLFFTVRKNARLV